MKFYTSLVVATAYFNFCLSLPVQEVRIETIPELLAGYIEGDMVPNMEARNGLRDEWYRWPNNTVYYKFHEKLNDVYANKIFDAMRAIERFSCLRFEKATNDQSHYLNITTLPNGCYAHVGYIRRAQNFNLQKNVCFDVTTIIHELFHSCGFYHMQSATDRDNYVRINVENIMPGYEHNFNKYSDSFIENYGLDYDYGSLMHYAPNAFSVNGKNTIEALVDTEESRRMGQRNGMSLLDVKKLNIMYNC